MSFFLYRGRFKDDLIVSSQISQRASAAEGNTFIGEDWWGISTGLGFAFLGGNL